MCAEAEDSGLVELIVQVDQAALDGAAKMQIVLALFPADVVGPSVVVASEERGGVVTEGEPTLNADALNGIGSRLERERSPESGDACGVGSRAAVGDFARIAKTEVIDEARREDMGFVRQEVLRGDRKSGVGVGDEQQRIKNGGFGEAIEFVATTELVILTEGVIDAADGGVEVLNVGLREWHGRLLTGRNCAGQAELWRSERSAGGWVDAEKRGNGWIDHASRASCDSRGSAASETGRAFGSQKVGDVGLPDDVLAAQDKVTK